METQYSDSSKYRVSVLTISRVLYSAGEVVSSDWLTTRRWRLHNCLSDHCNIELQTDTLGRRLQQSITHAIYSWITNSHN